MDHLIPNQPPPPRPQDCFEARPSPRVGKDVQADGDTWQETLAVCEAPNGGKLVIRSYYQNARSGKRVWDEPPSGASVIKPASEEMRRMAQLQLQEMQVVTGGVPDTSPNDQKGNNKNNKKGDKSEKSNKKGGGGFFFRRKKNSDKEKEKTKSNKNNTTIQYKAGSKLLIGSRKAQQQSSRSQADEVNDLRMQEAIARSIAEASGIPYVPGEDNNASVGGGNTQQEEEELAMAKALSMSEAEVVGGDFASAGGGGRQNNPAAAAVASSSSSWPPSAGTPTTPMSEDFLLRQALEESRREAQKRPKQTESEEKCEVVDLVSQFTTISSQMMMNHPNIDAWPNDSKPTATTKKSMTPSSSLSSKLPPPSPAGKKPDAATLKSPPSYPSNPLTSSSTTTTTPTSYGIPSPVATGGLKSPPSYVTSPAAGGIGGLKSPPSYAQNSPSAGAVGGLKAPPPYTQNIPAAPSGGGAGGLAAPLTPTPNYITTPKAAQSPIAMFDPYAKDAPSPASTQLPPPPIDMADANAGSTGQGLNKLTEEDGQRGRLHFGRRSSTKQMQDKAGVV